MPPELVELELEDELLDEDELLLEVLLDDELLDDELELLEDELLDELLVWPLPPHPTKA